MHNFRSPLAVLLLLCGYMLFSQATVTGELRKWHTVTIFFNGPNVSENDATNPFMDYRLNVTFNGPGGSNFVVPGFYAADGDAANSGANSGNKWAVRFTPDKTGTWTYTASFRKGTEVAIKTSPTAGSSHSFDGTTGSFSIGSSNKALPDHRANGRLQYVGDRYLKFKETGKYFLKAGADAPENLLAYSDIDNTKNSKDWSPHLQDWNSGDPTWKNGKGKGLIGAINYLNSKGMNAFSFITMNVIGDGKDVWPWVASNHSALDGNSSTERENRKRYDVSKLEQWEVLFSHADTKGMYLHFKTQETENDMLLDGGDLDEERKLYYRELIARFGHHLALNWNLGEENDLYDPAELGDTNNNRVKSYATYFQDLDPYGNHVVIHSYPFTNAQDQLYTPLLGYDDLTGASIQTYIEDVHDDIKKWISLSANSGNQWVVANDEQGPASTGVAADNNYSGSKGNISDNREEIRHKVLWGTLMAGGAGVEYYFGYQTGQTDLNAQDYRSRKTKWEDAQHAIQFFNDYLPFWDMEENDNLASKSEHYCFAKTGDIYVLYLPNGGSGSINLSGQSGEYTIKWFNPRSGSSLLNGSKIQINGGANRNFGNPPHSVAQDWVVLIEKKDGGNSGSNNCEAEYEEDNGIVVIEAENLSLVNGWQVQTSKSDYSGDGYLNWQGGNYFSQPGNGVITQKIKINQPGTYRFQWRNRVGYGSQSSEHNDSWLRFPDASDFYGKKGSSIVYPKGSGKSPNPNGSGSDGWFKIYLSGNLDWTWSTKTSDNDSHNIYVEFDSPGIYTMEISGRSNDHLIDRIVLFNESLNGTDLSLSETFCEGPATIAVESVELSPQQADMLIGETLNLNYTILPANATNKSIGWSSSDASVATINSSGKVTALSEGTAIITITTADGGHTSTSTITVRAEEEPDPDPDPDSDPDPDPDPDPDSEPEPDASRPPSITIENATGNEGENLDFALILDKEYDSKISVNLSYINESTDKFDYWVATDSITFAPGETQKIVSVPTYNDEDMEQDEIFLVKVSKVMSGELYDYSDIGIGTILNEDSEMIVSPNPARANSSVRLSGMISGEYFLELYSVGGELLSKDKVLIDPEHQYNVGNLARGIYVLRAVSLDNSYASKLIVR